MNSHARNDSPMKIFISHSSSDKPLVDALHALISTTFAEAVEVVYSSASVSAGGISAGQDWLDWVRIQVQESLMTIVVLTPLSKTRPWLMWEAGAVTGVGLVRRAVTPVVPLLFGLKSDEVPSPLRLRQTKSGSAESEVRDLLESIRRVGNLTYQSNEQVHTALQDYMAAINKARIPGMYDVFISCPMTSIDEPEYGRLKTAVEALCQAITARGFHAYCALMRLTDREQPDPEAIAAEMDFAALMASRHFVMIYPRRIISSCLLEAGYALVAGIPSVYFVRSDEDLPYTLRGAVESFRNARRVRFRQEREIVDFYCRYPDLVIT